VPLARIVLLAATLAGIVLSIRSIVREPPSLAIAIACIAGYLGFVLWGVFDLRLRMFADAIVRGPKDARGVALTFDDGPHAEHTRAVLDILDAHEAKATFFVIGMKAEANAELLHEIARRGHAIGVHGFDHDRFMTLRSARRVRKDLRRALKTIETITGKRPEVFRPPIGHTNPTIARVADELDLTIVGWSVRGRDGLARTKPADVVSRVRPGLRDGAIVMLHDAAERGERRPAGVEALPDILDAIASQNLVVTPLAEWL
jgi:peptidoglycan/xylan/chitin deacetylase (PgdA/CDA1 family)